MEGRDLLAGRPAAPTPQMRHPVLTLARASANKPGQKGSPCTRRSDEGTDLTLRDGHLTHLTVPCRLRRADASELRGPRPCGGRGRPAAVLLADGPSTLAAAEEMDFSFFLLVENKDTRGQKGSKEFRLQVLFQLAYGVNQARPHQP